MKWHACAPAPSPPQSAVSENVLTGEAVLEFLFNCLSPTILWFRSFAPYTGGDLNVRRMTSTKTHAIPWKIVTDTPAWLCRKRSEVLALRFSAWTGLQARPLLRQARPC